MRWSQLLIDLPVGPGPLARDPRLGALRHQRLGCEICAADFVALAALVVYPGSFPAAEAGRPLVTMLRELGVRFLRLRNDSLPRPGEMPALVLG